MARREVSPAIKMMDLARDSACGAVQHAWERYNHALRYALTLAVGGGFRFDEADYAHILKSYGTGYWVGESDEWIYALAVMVGNMSAIKSFEAARGRRPFIADEVDPGENRGGFVHRLGVRDRERLAVGFAFPWKGERVKVTSFAADGTHVIACSYRMNGERKKLSKRFRITHEAIRSERAARKAEGKHA